MNDGKGFCDHEFEDYSCVCQLEAIIERRENLQGLLFMMGGDPQNVDAFKTEYYTNTYVYNLVNLFEQMYAEFKTMKAELERLRNGPTS